MRGIYKNAVLDTYTSHAIQDVVDGSPDDLDAIADQVLTLAAELCRQISQVLANEQPTAIRSIVALQQAENELRSIVEWDGKPGAEFVDAEIPHNDRFDPPPGPDPDSRVDQILALVQLARRARVHLMDRLDPNHDIRTDASGALMELDQLLLFVPSEVLADYLGVLRSDRMPDVIEKMISGLNDALRSKSGGDKGSG